MSLVKQISSTVPNLGQAEQMKRKFGMFLHFGVNTFGNTEWSDGSIPAQTYDPTELDADQWVHTAYEAGMNYVILVTKHHDGFCLWDTKYTEYCVRNSKNTTDVVAAVSKACEKYDIKLGLYYSLWDRNAKEYIYNFDTDYAPYMLNQLTELMDGRYGEVVELWLDGGWEKTRSQWKLDQIYDLVKRLQPKCQMGVNHTVGDDDETLKMPEDRYLPKNYQQGDPLRMFPSDFRLYDPMMCREDDPKIYTFQEESYYLPFELTICSREGSSWFYSDAYEERPFLDFEQTVKNCMTIFETNNIVVLNLPPNTKGKLVQSDIDHLMEISRTLGLSRI